MYIVAIVALIQIAWKLLHFLDGSFSVYADSNTEPFFHTERLKTIIDKTKVCLNIYQICVNIRL